MNRNRKRGVGYTKPASRVKQKHSNFNPIKAINQVLIKPLLKKK